MRFFPLLCLLSVTVTAQRGFGDGKSGKSVDLKLLSGVPWFYSWGLTPHPGLTDGVQEFVPMVWGGKKTEELPTWVPPPHSTALLGFNEPNLHGQANLTPSQACAKWSVVLNAAKVHRLRVGSPAANHCHPNKNCFQTPTDWFDDFFALPGCGLETVDFIATHKYGCNVSDTVEYVKMLNARYKKPIWLTEFSCAGAPVDKQLAFMKEILPIFDSMKDVLQRYAWFAARSDHAASGDTDSLIHLNGTMTVLTVLGEYYNSTSGSNSLSSASPAFNIWPGTAPNESHKIGPEVQYQDNNQSGCNFFSRNQNCDLIANVTTPTLTPFLVTNGTGAAVVIAPGGGYTILAYDKEGKDIASYYNSIGVSAFLLKYRVPARPAVEGLPKWWAALQDAQRSISLVRSGAERSRWGGSVNSSRIGFTGFSAGGHLTAHVSTSWRKRSYMPVDKDDESSIRPDFSIFGYPWMLFPDNKAPAWGDQYTLAKEFTGVTAPDKHHPKSMFLHNVDDPIAPVQGSLLYASKLLEVGAPTSSLHIGPVGGHGFGFCQNGADFATYREICDWPKQVQRFLQVNNWTVGDPSVTEGKPPAVDDMLTQNC